jgi:hypothetical protein
MEENNSQGKEQASWWSSLGRQLRRWLGQQSRAGELHRLAHLEPEDIRHIVRGAFRETGAGDLMKQYVATEEPEERRILVQKWEEKMAERRAERHQGL